MIYEIENPMVLSSDDLSIGPRLYTVDDPEPEDICCGGCGYLLDFETEDIAESDLWEDEFHHNNPECKRLYKKKNDQLVGASHTK